MALFKSGDDWTFELLDKTWAEIEEVAKELQISYYPPQIEVVSAEQMLDAYSSIGMPIFYRHWSFGKSFIRDEERYKRGVMGLAYEMVINSNPSIAYLMEENNMTMQALVMAHASVGHSAVFKNNYLFKQTDADSIIDYLNFARNYIKMCEEKYGEMEVEFLLDACHVLSDYGIDKYKKTKKLRPEEEEKRALARFDQELEDYNPLWEKLVGKKKEETIKTIETFPKEPVDNLLYFLEKNAPNLPTWKREILRISRKIAQYFSPQAQTKVLNEGYASFCHYYIMNRLYEKGLIDDGSLLDFLQSHCGVLKQMPYDAECFSGFNPYALGFAIFMDIKRMCEHPTEEDRTYFPEIAGANWVEQINYAMMNFKDDSFIAQYLSPKVIRDFKMFHVSDLREHIYEYTVEAIQDQSGFYQVREKLSDWYNRVMAIPDIQVDSIDVTGDRTMTLVHNPHKGMPLQVKPTEEALWYVRDIWGFPVELQTFQYNNGKREEKLYRA